MSVPAEKLEKVIPLFVRDGWQVVNVHTIGDHGNDDVLNAFAKSLDGVDVSAMRPRLEHAQIMRDDDIKHLGKMGVIASIQPSDGRGSAWSRKPAEPSLEKPRLTAQA